MEMRMRAYMQESTNGDGELGTISTNKIFFEVLRKSGRKAKGWLSKLS
jgi:hypothetical protein